MSQSNSSRHVIAATRTAISIFIGTYILLLPACTPDNVIITSPPDFQDEPGAHALFDQMIDTIRKADSLSYSCHQKWMVKNEVITDLIYRVWLKKPNYFRVEVSPFQSDQSGKPYCILVGDGETAWTYWPQGRPRWNLILENDEEYQKNRLISYRKEMAPIGEYSIGHGLEPSTKNGMNLPVVNPSVFHGYSDSLLENDYLSGVRSLGEEKIEADICHKIELNIMSGQRSWFIWLSPTDNLPRKTKEIVRLDNEFVMIEDWSQVEVNGDISSTLFQWQPPEDWVEWVRPEDDDQLLEIGKAVPDFEFISSDGSIIKRSDYLNKVVWLYFWRVGCPPCREGMGPMQELYRKYNNKEFEILAFNSADDANMAISFLQEKDITFPCIVDSSEEARKVAQHDFRCSAMPTNYILDRQGKVIDAWTGYWKGHERVISGLEKAGITLPESIP